MKLYFKEKIFSWFDSYDIYDEKKKTVYKVKGQLSWGHCLKIFDAKGKEVGMVKEKVITLLPKFQLYKGGKKIGSLHRNLTLLRPKYELDFNDWEVKGSLTAWDYTIRDKAGKTVGLISKELFHLTDHYVLDVKKKEDALYVLMVALAIDAEKCTESKSTED